MKRRNFHLVHAINSLPMHISKASVMSYLPSVIELMTTDIKGFYDEDDEDSEVTNQQKLTRYLGQFAAATTEAYVQDYYYDYPPVVMNGNVVVINIQGAIMQEDYCGTAGTKTIQAWYELAKNDPKIKGVIELCNSGGGSVLGTHELANYKLNYPKPIVSLTEGLRCSAMEYIACASSWMMATSENCIVGSIGVMTTFVDYTAYYAEKGINVYELYSKTSPLKNDASRQANQGNFSGYTDGILFKLDQTFMGFVKAQRPDISEKALKGADFTAKDAFAEGLMDDIGNLADAYAKVIELSVNTDNNLTPNTKMAKQTKAAGSFLTRLKAFLSAESDEDESGEDAGENSDEGKNDADSSDDDDSGEPDANTDNSTDEKDAKIAQLEADLAAANLKAKTQPAAAATRVFPQGNKEKQPGSEGAKKDWTQGNAEHVQRAKAAGLI